MPGILRARCHFAPCVCPVPHPGATARASPVPVQAVDYNCGRRAPCRCPRSRPGCPRSAKRWRPPTSGFVSPRTGASRWCSSPPRTSSRSRPPSSFSPTPMPRTAGGSGPGPLQAPLQMVASRSCGDCDRRVAQAPRDGPRARRCTAPARPPPGEAQRSPRAALRRRAWLPRDAPERRQVQQRTSDFANLLVNGLPAVERPSEQLQFALKRGQRRVTARARKRSGRSAYSSIPCAIQPAVRAMAKMTSPASSGI